MKPCYVDMETRAIADVDSHGNGYYLLSRLNVPVEHRNKGVATRLLNEIIHDADAEGATIELWVMPSGDMGPLALAAWYGRLGWKQIKGAVDGRLVREPDLGRYIPPKREYAEPTPSAEASLLPRYYITDAITRDGRPAYRVMDRIRNRAVSKWSRLGDALKETQHLNRVDNILKAAQNPHQ